MSVRLTALLTGAGHNAAHVYDFGLAGRPDIEVLDAAREEGRVLISADTDFGDLVARSGVATPSVILFRRANRNTEHQAAVLNGNLDAVAADLDAGAVVVFTDDRIRVRRLPI